MKNASIISATLAVLPLTLISAARAQQSSLQKIPDLGGTSWRLVKFEGGDGKSLTPAAEADYTVAFGSDGRVSVRIDCNRGHGTWKWDGGNRLVFGPLALTRALCPPEPLNDRIAKDWEHVHSYVLKGGRLFLSLMADGGTYEFEPLTPSTSSAVNDSHQAAIADLPATFAGTLPCADCPGTRYQLNLFPDHSYVLRMTYEERTSSFDERGRWRLMDNGEILVLQGGRKGATKFRVLGADTLRQLDANGGEIESKLNYDLKRAPAFAPIPYGSTSPSHNRR